MAYTPSYDAVKLDKLAQLSFEILKREVMLPHLINTLNGDQFKGALDDSVTVKVPGRAKARRRDLRPADEAARKLVMDPIKEQKFQVSIDQNIYSGVPLEDEVLTFDMEDVIRQILRPQLEAVAMDYEYLIADEIESANYLHEVPFDPANVWESIVDASRLLDLSWVPRENRVLLVGTEVKTAILKDKQFISASSAGDALASSRLVNATLGQIAGYTVVESQAIDPSSAYLFHKTAFAAVTVTPAVPSGAAFGRQMSGGSGPSLTWLKDYDFEVSRDRSLVHFYAGTNTFEDLADDRVVGNDLVKAGGLLRAVRLSMPTT